MKLVQDRDQEPMKPITQYSICSRIVVAESVLIEESFFQEYKSLFKKNEPTNRSIMITQVNVLKASFLQKLIVKFFHIKSAGSGLLPANTLWP